MCLSREEKEIKKRIATELDSERIVPNNACIE